ncbi:MAG: OmpA/MotB family protein [Thermodesulfobacteriota bacterium]
MGRSRSKKGKEEGMPAWLITFSDIMTLLLTFFVLLLSMASMEDIRKTRLAWTSLSGTFGLGTQGKDVLRLHESKETQEPGPMSDSDDLQPLQDLMWDENLKDVDLLNNRFMQIFSMGGDVLFRPGQSRLTDSGRKLLKRVVPVLKEAEYPFLLTGHSSSLRDEFGKLLNRAREKNPEALWRLSLNRVLAVYKYFLDSDLSPERIRVEAFGNFRPRFDSSTVEGRKKNRRVEIVMDKRQSDWQPQLSNAASTRKKIDKDEFIYKDFEFDFNRTRITE